MLICTIVCDWVLVFGNSVLMLLSIHIDEYIAIINYFSQYVFLGEVLRLYLQIKPQITEIYIPQKQHLEYSNKY